MNNFKELQQIFQTLADYNRLVIINSIGDKECSVGELVKTANISQPLVSHHLRVLREKGILETKRNGPFIYYFIKDVKLLYAINLFAEIFWNNEVSNSDFRFCPDWIIEKFKTKL